MTISQPNVLLVFAEGSGANITNYGTEGSVFFVGSQAAETTNFVRHTAGTGPYGSNNGFLESKTTDSSAQVYVDTALATAESGAPFNINCAIGFRITTLSSTNVTYLISAKGGDGDVRLYAYNPSGSNFDVALQFNDVGSFATPAYVLATGLSTGVDYIVSTSLDITGHPTTAQVRYKINALTAVSPATVDFGGSGGFREFFPYLLARSDTVNNFGMVGRFNFFAYQRGGSIAAWSTAELDSINANPLVLPGWPGADTTPPTYGVNPHSTAITDTTATFQATATDAIATHVDHYMAIYAAASTPTADNVKAAAGTGFVAGSNRSSTNILNGVTSSFTQVTGLSAATNYRAAFTVEEFGGGNLRTVFYVDFKTAPTLLIGTKGHLTVSGKTVLIGAAAVVTKVVFTITKAWDSTLYSSISGIGYAIFPFNHSTQAVGAMFVSGTTETTDGSGVISIVTTTIGHFVNDTVMVVYWKLAGGPSGEDIVGVAWPSLVAGP